MEVLISNWSNVQSLPESYVFPPERRPGTDEILASKDIPIIDLEGINGPGRFEIVQHIMNASQNCGLFQVINHGVSRDLTDQTMRNFQEFFTSPAELKARFYSNDLNSSCRLYTSTLNSEKEDTHYWRDNLTHQCHPLEDHIEHWPENPPDYRMLQQGDVCGLQALKDGRWIRIAPLRDAFVVIPGLQLRVISNGKLASAVHRVVTNLKESRTTIGIFLTPSNDIQIRPADGLLGCLTPMYRGYTYKEFFDRFTGNDCDAEKALGWKGGNWSTERGGTFFKESMVGVSATWLDAVESVWRSFTPTVQYDDGYDLSFRQLGMIDLQLRFSGTPFLCG
ncbi:hypothetical protein L1887_14637 [Cichorium endivia]|nr:hypothetical protein L1887_14637 [Cichorium endivia]